MKTVASPENPVIKTVRRLQHSPHHRAEDRFILEGVKLVDEALATGTEIVQALLSLRFAESPTGRTVCHRLEQSNVPMVAVDERIFRRCSSLETPEGILLIARRKVGALRSLTGNLVVMIEGIQDPGNVGAIARVAEASGASALVACRGSAHPFHPRALRGSMGSLLRLPVFDGGNPADALGVLRGKQLSLAACLPQGGVDFREANLRQPLAVLLGAESTGLSRPLLEMADVRVSVPMTGTVDSLNVAVVAGLVLYEAARQRGAL
jgi:TrmH family RNA methyltransferase